MPDHAAVAVVDDDQALRTATADLLRYVGHSVLEFDSGTEFLAAQLPERLGCLLLDMRMPGADGISVMRALLERGNPPSVLVLTGHGDVPSAVEAMKLGAVDFIEKPYAPAALLEAIRRACARPASTTPGSPAVNEEARARVAALPRRQREILQGILKGQPNKIIAYDLGLSVRTVEAYRATLLEGLGVRGTAEAVRLAIAAGMAGED